MNKNININIYKPNRCVKSLSNAGSAKKEKGEAGNAKDQVRFVADQFVTLCNFLVLSSKLHFYVVYGCCEWIID